MKGSRGTLVMFGYHLMLAVVALALAVIRQDASAMVVVVPLGFIAWVKWLEWRDEKEAQK